MYINVERGEGGKLLVRDKTVRQKGMGAAVVREKFTNFYNMLKDLLKECINESLM